MKKTGGLPLLPLIVWLMAAEGKGSIAAVVELAAVDAAVGAVAGVLNGVGVGEASTIAGESTAASSESAEVFG